MAKLMWGGKVSPKAFIVAETSEEEAYIHRSKTEIAKGIINGRTALIVSATKPLDYIFNLQKEVSLGSRTSYLFPGRILTLPERDETSD